ncbi:MAG: glycoside-pentoside-hexuronide (GPH):cation symporter [Myxococcota bacterium]
MVFSLGDHTVNLALSALGLVFLFFLTEIVGLRPALAGLLIWIARIVDALTDPLMGGISDATTWRRGRRRPYFLIGAIPFGLFFALLWRAPFEAQGAMFAYYLSIYIALSLSMTVVSVPYMALLPEMASDYDERTSLNTFRSAAAVMGTLAAVGLQPLASTLGGDRGAFAAAGALFAIWLVLPWAAVYRVSWERPRAATSVRRGARGGLSPLVRHPNYRRLCALYISARVAVDITGLALLYFFTYWLGRPEDFAIMLISLMACVLASLPIWLRVARSMDKHRIFSLGAGWWMALMFVMFQVQPDWPRSALFILAGSMGIGYAVADLMPWAMIGEVIDEGELRTGQRRDGIYNGFFTFLRKLGGASAALLAGLVLDLSGYTAGQPQNESALLAIRTLTTLVPALFLALAILVAMRYPLTRARHQQILAALRRRDPQREPQ